MMHTIERLSHAGHQPLNYSDFCLVVLLGFALHLMPEKTRPNCNSFIALACIAQREGGDVWLYWASFCGSYLIIECESQLCLLKNQPFKLNVLVVNASTHSSKCFLYAILLLA